MFLPSLRLEGDCIYSNPSSCKHGPRQTITSLYGFSCHNAQIEKQHNNIATRHNEHNKSFKPNPRLTQSTAKQQCLVRQLWTSTSVCLYLLIQLNLIIVCPTVHAFVFPQWPSFPKGKRFQFHLISSNTSLILQIWWHSNHRTPSAVFETGRRTSLSDNKATGHQTKPISLTVITAAISLPLWDCAQLSVSHFAKQWLQLFAG